MDDYSDFLGADFLSEEEMKMLIEGIGLPTQVGSMSQDLIPMEEIDFDEQFIEEDVQTEEFKDIDLEMLPEEGQNHADWLYTTAHLKSGGVYNDRVLHFLKWKKNREEEGTLCV